MALTAGVLDELHHLHELFVGQFQVGLVGGSTEGKHGEKTPAADAQGDEVVAELRQVIDVTLVDAGDDVPGEARVLFHGFHGHQHVLEAVGVAAHPVVVVFEPVEADGDRLQSRLDKGVEELGGEQHAVAHHAPHEAALGDLASALCQVTSHGGLAAGGDDHHLGGVHVGFDLVEDLGEIGERHVVLLGEHAAVAATMTAVEVATKGALPEKLVQLMVVDAVHEHGVVEFEQQPLVEAESFTLCHLRQVL